MPDAVLFDLDETLLDRTTSLRAFLQGQFGRFASELGAVQQDHWAARFVELDKRGSVHKSKVYPALLDEFGGNANAADALFADYATRCCEHAQAFHGMEAVLTALRQAGKRLAIVTNGESIFQRRHITTLCLERLVDEILVSEEETLRKPDAALFRLAATRLGVQPAQCLFVGDNPAVDVLGAATAGMQTLWFRRGQAWPRDLPANPGATVEKLTEVLAFAK